jgi:GntR family transcriptional regulator
MTVDHAGGVPPYQQLAEILRDQIASGELAAGQPIPSIAHLQQTYGLARTTVRKAVKILADEGLVNIVQGWGTFVL